MNLSGRADAANRCRGSWLKFEIIETVSHWFVDESEGGKLWKVMKREMSSPQYTVNV